MGAGKRIKRKTRTFRVRVLSFKCDEIFRYLAIELIFKMLSVLSLTNAVRLLFIKS